MNINQESKRFQRRSMVCGAGILFLFILLLLRLMYLQLYEHRFYATLSKRNVISIIPVKPSRGLIFDRNGVLLAKNIPVYSLMVIPGRVKHMKDTLQKLSKLIQLTPDDIHAFYHIMKQYYPYQAVPLKQQLTEAQVDSFYVNQYRFPGVVVQTNMIRNYPLGKSTSNVVGYVGRITTNELADVDPTNYTASDEIGKAGIEAEDETLLHGTMGSEEAEIDATGKVVRILKKTPPISGDNIYLTIDSKLQAYAQQLLGKYSGAVVAIQPSTGQVLALVTKPGYDPNAFVQGLSNSQYHAILSAPNHPLFNRPTRATYAPGSTVKPFIAFGALNDGVINTQSYIFDPGFFRIPHTKHIFHNWVRKGFGWVNVIKAIRVSCDTFFYELAYVLGIDRLDQALTQFGFGQITGINLPMEQSGVVPSPQWKEKHIGQAWYTGDTVNAGIGQGYVSVTPLQLASAASTMAERGLRFQPNVLLKLQQPNGIITAMQPIVEKPVVATEPTAWQTVITGMQQVVNHPGGTAYSTFQGAGYTAAGKTGTAQLVASIPGSKNVTTLNNHLFICFSPVDNPQIAIAVVVERVPGMTEVAIQITRQLLDFYFKELQQQGVSPTPATPQTILPTPQTSSLPPTKPASKQLLPAPAGPSLLPQETLQSIKTRQMKPAPQKPTTPSASAPSLPTPGSPASSVPTSNLSTPSTIKSPYLDQLQQEMEMKVKARMEMQAATEGASNAATDGQ